MIMISVQPHSGLKLNLGDRKTVIAVYKVHEDLNLQTEACRVRVQNFPSSLSVDKKLYFCSTHECSACCVSVFYNFLLK